MAAEQKARAPGPAGCRLPAGPSRSGRGCRRGTLGMEHRPSSRSSKTAAPQRMALAVLTCCYGLGLAATAFLLVYRAVRIDWGHQWARLTRPPIRYPAGYVAPRLPMHVKLPPAPVLRRAPRVIVWQSLPPLSEGGASGARRPARRRWSPRRSLSRRPPAGVTRAPLLTWAPQRAPMPTWAHPPDPTLPPECRPPHPVVVGQ